MTSTTRVLRHQLLLSGIFLLCIVVYLRGLFGGFLLDDFGSIVDNPGLRFLDGTPFRWLVLALSSPAGILRRPVSMLSFGVDFSLFGLSPLAFKATNLAIHLFNGWLVYKLACRLVPRLAPQTGTANPRSIALVAATLWLLHPLNVSDVVYIVQRMNLLATLFTLAGLLCYVEGRERMLLDDKGAVLALAGVCAFGALAILSKENGALVFVYALVIEALCFRFVAHASGKRSLIKGFFWVTVALPIALCLVWLCTRPHWLINAYAGRDFTLGQRLLTEPRVLCDYLLWIFIPNPAWMGLYHDGEAISNGLFNPWTTLPAIVFLSAVVAGAWRWRREHPGLAFAIAWFLAGHSMESSFFPLELVFEHRNYLPMAGLFVGIASSLCPWLPPRIGALPIRVASAALVVALACVTAVRANTWGDPVRLAVTEADNHPYSSRALYNAGRTILVTGIANDDRDAAERQALPYFERCKAQDPIDLFCPQSIILIQARHDSQHHAAPEAISDFARRVRETRLPQINPLLVVLTAATDGRLYLSPEQVQSLVDAVMQSDRYPHTERAMVLSDYGHYQFQVAHDNQAAVSLTLAAAAEDPRNPLFQVNLAKLALALGDADKAEEHIGYAQQLNVTRTYDGAIADLRERVKAARAPQG